LAGLVLQLCVMVGQQVISMVVCWWSSWLVQSWANSAWLAGCGQVGGVSFATVRQNWSVGHQYGCLQTVIKVGSGLREWLCN